MGPGLLAEWSIQDGPSATYVPVGEAVTLDFPNFEVAKIERRGLAYTNVKYSPGLVDCKGFTFSCNLDGDEYTRLVGLLGDEMLMRVDSPPDDDVRWAFTGFICALSGTMEPNAEMSVKGEVCIVDAVSVGSQTP